MFLFPRYYILNPNVIPKGFVDNKKASELILSSVGLDNMEYRIGHTKVLTVIFRGGKELNIQYIVNASVQGKYI